MKSTDKSNLRLALAMNPSLPSVYLLEIAEDKDKDLLYSLSRNTNLPSDILEKLSRTRDQYIRAKVADHPSASIDVLERLSRDRAIIVRCRVAGRPFSNDPHNKQVLDRHPVVLYEPIPADILERMSQDDDYEVRMAVAQNDSTPANILVALGNEFDVVARHPNIPIETLEYFANNYPEIASGAPVQQVTTGRNYVASNPSAPVALLSKLSSDFVSSVRGEVAANPSSPMELLQKMMRQAVVQFEDAYEHFEGDAAYEEYCLGNEVLKGIAKNPSISMEILCELLDLDQSGAPLDGDYYEIFEEVFENPATLTLLLQELMNSDVNPLLEESSFSETWFQILSNNTTGFKSFTPFVNEKVFKLLFAKPPYNLRSVQQLRGVSGENLDVPEFMLSQLSRDSDPDIRIAVASNQQCPEEVLSQLANDSDFSVRKSVASNSATPPTVLEVFAGTKDPELIYAVATNPSTSVELLEKLYMKAFS